MTRLRRMTSLRFNDGAMRHDSVANSVISSLMPRSGEVIERSEVICHLGAETVTSAGRMTRSAMV